MHIKIHFASDKDITLPVHYNHIVQGFIYANIDSNLSDFLHNQGYIYNGRNFKLFAFSNILSKGEKINDHFYFGKKISLVISSPLDDFCRSLANSMIQKEELLLGRNILNVEKVEIENCAIDKEEVIVRTLSPIVVYSTLFRADGSKYTCYFTPGEPDFERIISENLIKKYRAINHSDGEEFECISVKSIGPFRQNLVIYKDFIIKGVSGKFVLKGDKRLLQMGLDAGLGSKNSQGFGCIIIN